MPASIAHQLLELAPTTSVADALLSGGATPGGGAPTRARRASPAALLAAAAADPQVAIQIAEDELTAAEVLAQMARTALHAAEDGTGDDAAARWRIDLLESLAANQTLPDSARQAVAAYAQRTGIPRLLIALTQTMDPRIWIPVVDRMLPDSAHDIVASWISVRLSRADAATVIDTIRLLLDLDNELGRMALVTIARMTGPNGDLPAATGTIVEALDGKDRDQFLEILLHLGRLHPDVINHLAAYLERTPSAQAPTGAITASFDVEGLTQLLRTGHPVAGKIAVGCPMASDWLVGDVLDLTVSAVTGKDALRLLAAAPDVRARLDVQHIAALVRRCTDAQVPPSLGPTCFEPDVWAALDDATLASLLARGGVDHLTERYVAGSLHRAPTRHVLELAFGQDAGEEVRQHTDILFDVSAGPDEALGAESAPGGSEEFAAQVRLLGEVLDLAGPHLLDASDWRRPGVVPMPVAYAAHRVQERFGTDPRAWLTVAQVAQTFTGTWTDTLDAAAAILA